MLVLKHKLQEAGILTLDDLTRCEVRVVEIGPSWVKLGYEFPKSVTIHRDSIQNRVDGIDPQPKPSVAAILKHRKD